MTKRAILKGFAAKNVDPKGPGSFALDYSRVCVIFHAKPQVLRKPSFYIHHESGKEVALLLHLHK